MLNERISHVQPHLCKRSWKRFERAKALGGRENIDMMISSFEARDEWCNRSADHACEWIRNSSPSVSRCVLKDLVACFFECPFKHESLNRSDVSWLVQPDVSVEHSEMPRSQEP